MNFFLPILIGTWRCSLSFGTFKRFKNLISNLEDFLFDLLFDFRLRLGIKIIFIHEPHEDQKVRTC